MTYASLSMSSLYEKLSTIGLSKSYVRQMGLPSWWDDALNDNPAAVLEGAGHIAKRLHIDMKSLLTDEPIKFKEIPPPSFKYHNQINSSIPQTVPRIASRIMELVSGAVTVPFKPIPEDPTLLRQEIVQASTTVTLEALLTYCWERGIAVVYFNNYPGKIRKITAMIQWQGNRPVIILSSAKKYPAWLAFHLAHELGHLALGHVQEGFWLDSNDDIENKSNNIEEEAANRFAVKLLVGQLDNCFDRQKIYNAQHLLQKIFEKIKSDPSIDPCALAYNYAGNTKKYGCASKVVKSISSPNGDRVINEFLANHLDWENLSEDSTDHLEHILGD